MAYEIKDNDELTKSVSIFITEADLTKLVNQRLRKLQKNVKIHGFRKGKVPMSVLKQRYGGGAFQESVEDLLEQGMQQALAEIKHIVYVGEHDVKVNPDGSISSQVEVEVLPDLDLVGYLGLEIKAPTVEVTEDDVNEALSGIQRQFSVLEPVEDREVIETGDVLLIDFEPISLTVEDEKDGALAKSLTASNMHILASAEEENAPPFVADLIGCSISEPITSVVHIADILPQGGYSKEETCTLKITVHSINKEIIPELDDDLALETGIADTYEELLTHVREQLEQSKREERGAAIRREVGNKLLEKYTFEVPPNHLKNRLDVRLREQLQRFGFPDAFNPEINVENFFADATEIKDVMAKGLAEEIRIGHIARLVFLLEQLEVTNEELNEYAFQHAQQNQYDPQQYFAFLNKNPAATGVLLNILREKKALDFLGENAEITEVPSEEFYAEKDKELAAVAEDLAEITTKLASEEEE